MDDPPGYCRHCLGQYNGIRGLHTHQASCINAKQFRSLGVCAWPMSCTVSDAPAASAVDSSEIDIDMGAQIAADDDDDAFVCVKSPSQFEDGDWDVMLVNWMKAACGGIGLSNVDVNDLFALIKQPGFSVDKLTYKNAKTVNDYVRNLPSEKWETKNYTWELLRENKTVKAKLEYKLVKKVDLVSLLQKNITMHSGGKGWEWGYKETKYADGTRFVDRPTSGDWFKAMSERFPGKCILGILVYSDKSALNAKGSHVGYPGILAIVNGDMECIRDQYRTGCIAQLPALSRPKGVKASNWSKTKKILLGKLFADIFEALVEEINRRPDKVIIFHDSNGVERECVIGLHSHPCDLEEMVAIVGNVKTTCGLCFASKNTLDGYHEDVVASCKKDLIADCRLIQHKDAPPRTLHALSKALIAWDNSKTTGELVVAREECERLGMFTEGASFDSKDRASLISKYLIGFARVHSDCLISGPMNIFEAMHPCNLHGVWLGTWVNMVQAIPKLAGCAGLELKSLLELSPDLASKFKLLKLEFKPSKISVEELLTCYISDALVSVAGFSRWENFTVPIPTSYLTEVTKSDAKGKTGRKLNGREHKCAAQVLWAAIRGIAVRCRVNIPEVDAIFQLFEDRTLTLLVLFMDVQALNGRKNMAPGHTQKSIQDLKIKYDQFLYFLSYGIPFDMQTSQFCTPKAHLFSHFEQLWRSGCSDITSTDMGEAAQSISTKVPYLQCSKRSVTVQSDIAKNFEEGLAIDLERVRRNLPEDCGLHNQYKIIGRIAERLQTSVLGEIRCARLKVSDFNVKPPSKVTKALKYLCPKAKVAIGTHFKESLKAHLFRMLPRERTQDDHGHLGIIPCKHGIIFGAYLKHVPESVLTRPNMRIHAAGRYYGAVRHDMVFMQRDVPSITGRTRSNTTDYARLIFLFNTAEVVADQTVKNSFAFVQIHSCVNANVLPTSSWPQYCAPEEEPPSPPPPPPIILPIVNVSFLCAEDRYEVVPLLWLFRAVPVVPDMNKGSLDYDDKDSGDGLFARKDWIENPFKWNQEPRWNL